MHAKKNTRYETKQINTHPTNERSLFEGSAECAQSGITRAQTQHSVEEYALNEQATATSTETGNEAVQTAKTAAELSALRALDFASALALLEAAVINLNDIEL